MGFLDKINYSMIVNSVISTETERRAVSLWDKVNEEGKCYRGVLLSFNAMP